MRLKPRARQLLGLPHRSVASLGVKSGMPRPGGIFFGFSELCRTRPPPGKYVLSAMGLPAVPARPAIGTVAVIVAPIVCVSIAI